MGPGERRLAAIRIADVVGYSAMMNKTGKAPRPDGYLGAPARARVPETIDDSR